MADFYFSTSGSNTTGTGTELNPWQNFKGMKSASGALSPGDRCFFKRGDIWTGTNAEVKVESNGTSGNPIIIDAYGSGNIPMFCSAGITTVGWTYTGANSIYTLSGQSQSTLTTVTQDENKALGRWRGSVTTLPEGTFIRSGSTLYVRLWGNTDPAVSSVRVANYLQGDRGLVATGRTVGNYVHFKNIKVLGSNHMGFSSSRISTQWFDCVSIGSGQDGVNFVGYAPLGESATNCRWWRGEVSYNAASGTSFGQGITIGGPGNFVINCNIANGGGIHDNFMAGCDFLDYGTDTNVTECGVCWCDIWDNGRWQDTAGFDANVYGDGANNIWVFGNRIWGSGTVAGIGSNNARENIRFGSEHPTLKQAHHIYIVNNLIYKGHWKGIGTQNLPGTTDNISNLYVINNTIIALLTGGFDMAYNFADFSSTADNFVLRNNIMIVPGGSSRIDNYANGGVHLDADNNLYYRTNESTTIYTSGGVNYTLDQWRTLSGEDANSTNQNPRLVSLSDSSMDAHLEHLVTGHANQSPAIDAGMATPFTPPSWLPSDIFTYGGEVRGSTRTDGVFDDTTSSIDLGFHYNSSEAESGGAITRRNMLLMGV